MDTIEIKTVDNADYDFIINKKKAKDIKLEIKENASICFGSQKIYASINISDKIPYDNILMTNKLIDELHIPIHPKYEITAKNNDITIGPLIGLLVSSEGKHLTAARLEKMLIYMERYSELHGAIVVFALNKLDTTKRLVEGYCYNPEENDYQKGVFPYPSAFYRSIGLSDSWKDHFHSIIGDRFFNNLYFSKWQTYKWFKSDEKLSFNIPYTVLYKSYKDIFSMLNMYAKVYAKPISGLRGRGIVKIYKDNNKFIFKYRDDGENYIEEFDSENKAKEFIENKFAVGRYLIQQGIDLIKYRDRIVDFRCILQKNQTGKWICKAIIARVGGKDSIVSNVSNGGEALPGNYLLKKIYPDIYFIIKEKIETFTIDICNKLDSFGLNCGMLGLDIGIDNNEKLWLIEINNRDPDPSIALDLRDQDLYIDLKTDILFYAKYLAGF